MQNMNFIGPNPATPHCPQSMLPHIHPSAYVGPFASVIGDVTVCANVFIAPHVSVRADEGTPFYIGAHTNLQDGVILHGLAGKQISHDGHNYSIYIGQHVSCGHGCVIHGPCMLGDRVFVGFGALVLNAVVEEGCTISHHAMVSGGIHVAAGRYVPAGALVDTQQKADALPNVSEGDTAFAANVQRVNNTFPAAFAEQFGETTYSSGHVDGEAPPTDESGK
ncbi:MAG: carbonate dehydratase [Ethanoligenens sp.]